MVDSSASIEKAGKGNYKKCLDFIQNAINGSFISEEFTHVGLVLYSARVCIDIVANSFVFYKSKCVNG